MNIKQNLTKTNFRTCKNRKIEYVVVHYTAGKKDYNGAAYDNTVYFKEGYRGASAHYFVDKSDTVWQCVDDKNIAWHVGDKTASSINAPYHGKCTNTNSIGVEMVSYFTNGVYSLTEETLSNAAFLCAMLLNKYNLGPDRLICHFDVTGKLCPMPFITSGRKNEMWDKFIYLVVKNMSEKFKDTENHWAKEYIDKLSDYGIVSGDGNGFFYPDKPVTRAECAKMISNALLILGK